ncbi:MAG: glycogen/starch/alpha-glucan phosphorylase [Beijerinckiaceae bacterium]
MPEGALKAIEGSRRGAPAHVLDPAVAELRDAIVAKLLYSVGKDLATAQPRDWFVALAFAARDKIVDRWMDATRQTNAKRNKRVYYLSVEFLLGRLLADGLQNLGLIDTARRALAELGIDFDDILTEEPDAALGNGGLGRLAACFMDSMASLNIPAYGYGIRYDFGLFKQILIDGWQHEVPEDWLSFGNPWEFERPEVSYRINFGGFVEYIGGDGDIARGIWHPAESETLQAVAYDTPVIGWRGRHANTLRLWSARSRDPIQLERFNRGDHIGAAAERDHAEAISRVLYPSDETPAGQELRLRQEFFFVSASLQDIIRRHIALHGSLSSLPHHACLQLNDTHPAMAVAELMRLLFDEHEFGWHEAWAITTQTLNYTNHTLLPEALETWSLALMNRLLPRHMQIIFLINWFHLNGLSQEVQDDPKRLAGLSLIEENGDRCVRMGYLAFVGSSHVNGVSALHTELMRQTVFRDLASAYPERIVNKTNGVTFRRWLYAANPPLTALLVEALGPALLDDPARLAGLEHFADDAAFVERVAKARRWNKARLARVAMEQVGVKLDPDALFDVHIKRFHEYKRQLLNILETIALYLAIRDEPQRDWVPRVKIFSGKAAAGYARAKLIIKLAGDVARIVNSDPRIGDKLKVVFLPNYNVSLAEILVPAADLSEQISTAGLEASGTGNMKLALNGALTIGTMDGANIEISENVGLENIFIFGMTSDAVAARREAGFSGRDAVAASPLLARVLEELGAGLFSADEPARFKPLTEVVLGQDKFMVGADFDAYWTAQRDVDTHWRDRDAWWRASLLNTSRMAWFSSDRTIREYAQEIWDVPVGAAN